LKKERGGGAAAPKKHTSAGNPPEKQKDGNAANGLHGNLGVANNYEDGKKGTGRAQRNGIAQNAFARDRGVVGLLLGAGRNGSAHFHQTGKEQANSRAVRQVQTAISQLGHGFAGLVHILQEKNGGKAKRKPRAKVAVGEVQVLECSKKGGRDCGGFFCVKKSAGDFRRKRAQKKNEEQLTDTSKPPEEEEHGQGLQRCASQWAAAKVDGKAHKGKEEANNAQSHFVRKNLRGAEAAIGILGVFEHVGDLHHVHTRSQSRKAKQLLVGHQATLCVLK